MMTSERIARVASVGAPLLDLRLRTARLDLRPLVGSDAPALAEHLSDPEVTRWLARVPHPYRLSDAVTFVEQARLSAAAGAALTVALIPRDGDGSAIGVAVVHGLKGEPEFGYWLARPNWGAGLMGEAAASVLRHAVYILGLTRIRSGAFAGNIASLAIQRRNGFVVTGASHRLCLAEGRMKDHIDTLLEVRPDP
ncbi:MAG TPA: GNAT family N-acetyltransferase [Methylomirabilota bacterium]|nr:GNAT family N-acetyltransferase [Methylomirabilota bacterium]